LKLFLEQPHADIAAPVFVTCVGQHFLTVFTLKATDHA
jgi:hypothetical protein